MHESSATGDTVRPKILVVDDVRTNLIMTRGILKRLDAETFTATSGAEALDMQEEHRFAVVLLDVQMPEMDGFEVAERMRAAEATRRTPIIFVTASSEEEQGAVKGYETGAVDYLTKPVDPMILLSKVSVFVELQRKQAELEQTTRQLQLTIAKLEHSEKKLAQLARHDQLTGLANRRWFLELLGESINRANRAGAPVGLLSIDLDGFKAINDTLGHDAGDALLKEVAERLKGCVRVVDSVARLGGDEFSVLLEGMVSPTDAALVAKRLIERVAQPIALGESQRMVTASVGISTYPLDAQEIEGLLKCADVAMYEAKQAGKNQYQFFNKEMTIARTEQERLANRLRLALERDEFRLHYQPQLDLRTRKVIGFEALMRWERDGELVPPFQFIPTLEESGLIVPVGEWVIRTACEQVRAWQAEGLPPFRVSVNLSARQFRDQGLARLITRTLRETGVPAELLEVELTESLVMEETDNTIAILAELKQAGVRISIDDFGTGYSSLAYLKRFPLDAIKVDRAFVNDVPGDPNGCAIAEAIIGLAHSLNLVAIAEGVETEEQLAFLTERGCDGCQGFLFSKPRPPEDFRQLFTDGELEV